MSKEKLNRRRRMGDDPTAKSQSNMTNAGAPPPPQPLPYAPQNQKGGNTMNNPMVGMSMGGGMPQPGSMSGANMFPYGDSGLTPDDPRMGTIGFVPNSGMNQNMVPGNRLNQQPYNSTPQPMEDTMRMMEPLYLAQSASKTAQKMYGLEDLPPFEIGPIGMMGKQIDKSMGMGTPGSMPFNQPQQMPNTMPLQGMPDAQMAAGGGMNMGTGNRNA